MYDLSGNLKSETDPMGNKKNTHIKMGCWQKKRYL